MKATASGPRSTAFLNLTRGIASLWVAVAHCVMWSGGNVPDTLEPKKAVDLFMIVSGFLMFHNLDLAKRHDWPTWRSFYIRRFFRIAPAYYLALVTVIALWPLIGPGIAELQSLNPARWSGDRIYGPQFQDFSPSSIMLHLTFLFGLSPSLSSSTALPDWSLALEMQFYAAFPLIYIAARRRFLLTCAVLSGACLVFTREYLVRAQDGQLPRFDEPSLLLFNLPLFLVGALIYRAGKRAAPDWSLPLAILIFAVALRWSGLSVIPMAACAGFIAISWKHGLPGAVERVVASSFVTMLAELSYSLYLFHAVVIFALGPMLLRAGFSRPAFALAVVLISYAIAVVVYRLVETPCNAFAKTWTRSRQPIAPPMA